MTQFLHPCRCLCFEFSQITRTTPRRWMILHLSQIFLTEARTFINSFSNSKLLEKCRPSRARLSCLPTQRFRAGLTHSAPLALELAALSGAKARISNNPYGPTKVGPWYMSSRSTSFSRFTNFSTSPKILPFQSDQTFAALATNQAKGQEL